MNNDRHNRRDDNRPAEQLSWSEPAPAVTGLVDAMIDIESLGTTPGSAILSIGAVMFGQAGLGETFYAPVDLQSCTAVGLTIDPNTIAWWMQQSDAARAAAFRDDAEVLAVVLYRFTIWFTEVGAERPWCHGATFDVPLLEAAYKACGIAPPWKFWNVRDTRTLYDLGGVKVDRTQGTHHNALDDARVQAEAAVKALNILKGPTYVTGEIPADDLMAVFNQADTKRSAGAPLPLESPNFINQGDQPEDTAHLCCTTCGGSGHIDDQLTRQGQAGRFAWAAFAKNGNVIIWSHRRDQVKRVADRYCTSVKPVIVLHSAETAAARDILAERRRQVEEEGYILDHDDEHPNGELAAYAALHAMPPEARKWSMACAAGTVGEALVPTGWAIPVDDDRRQELVKAGALILAEIERIDRATIAAEQKGEPIHG